MTTTHNKILLTGCKREPLSSYLKGLAVLRLVSTQKDPTARGAWHGDTFLLFTALGSILFLVEI